MATLIAGGNWIVRGATFALWLLAAASAVTWGLKFSARASTAGGAPVSMRSAPAVDPEAVGRLLGASPAAAAANAVQAVSVASRFSLVGVAARRSGGAALIAVDGKPAKPFRVGSAVDEGIVLKSVEGRKAVLASAVSGQPVLTLELPLASSAGAAAAGTPGTARGGFPGALNGASTGGNLAGAPGGFAGAAPGGFPGGYPGAVQGAGPGTAMPPAQRPPPIPMAAPAPMAAPR